MLNDATLQDFEPRRGELAMEVGELAKGTASGLRESRGNRDATLVSETEELN